jgi:hypothetical protein
MAFQKPGQYIPIIDTGGKNIPVVNKPPRPGQYSPPQYNYAQQYMEAQNQARLMAQQEAERRAELDRLARLDAQRIADMRRRAYQEQMQALQRQADEQRKQQAEMIKAQQEAEKRAAREAKDAKAYQQYYNNVPRKEEALRQMWEFGGLNYRPGSLIQNMAYQNYNTLYGPAAPQNFVRDIDKRENIGEWGVYDPYGLYGERYGFRPYGEGWYKPSLNMFNWNDGRKNEYMEEIWPTPNYGIPELPNQPAFNYPDYGGYDYPTYDYTYTEPAKSWYENMLQWNIK